MLHPITRRFLDPAVELRYRESHIEQDRRQATITVGVLLMPLLGFFLSDLGFFTAGTVPPRLLLARIGVVAITIALIARLRWPIAPRHFDRAMGAWWLVVAAFILFVNSTRPPGYLLHNVIDSSVSIISFVSPVIAIGLQAAAPLVLATGNLLEVFAMRDLVGTTPLVVLPITYAMVLLIGFSTAWRLHGLRREQWAAMQQQLALQEQLEELANTDALTGALNRRRFLAVAEVELARALRHARPLGLLMLDVDHFKRINDTWGHAAGDAALVAIARTLAGTLRQQDCLARMGGEEFAILLPESPPAEASGVAERLRALCAELAWNAAEPQARLSVSIGVACLDAGDAGIPDLLRRADRALYDAKHAGRNRVVSR
jgi:diguanylate cyclase (GGDEF)-like protein